ncbi:MAG: DUF1295 domain-containing protein [Bacteroidetes bacterium]|nr:DUF1295 domain-containing protein [Bacteroidota bacterium]
MKPETLELITLIWIGLAIAVHVTMFYVTAPFGRHTSDKWGMTINNKIGWFIMELPSLLIMVYFLALGSNTTETYVWILFSLWIFHYLNRTIVYPLRIKSTEKKMPLFIVFNAIFFNVVNAGVNGYFLAEIATSEQYNREWLSSPHFIAGFIVFVTGMMINMKSDAILIGLRKKGETGYQIPRGFLFDYISSPNLLGEIIEWSGFALMAWNLPALSFAVWTFANLVPRALNHHNWYKEKFSDYPKERKAVFPFII